MNREEVIQEIHELEQDLKAFVKARDAIQCRVVELEDTSRYHDFKTWPAVVAAMAVNAMAIVRLEGLIEDYRRVLEQSDVPDNVRKINIVRRNDDDKSGS